MLELINPKMMKGAKRGGGGAGDLTDRGVGTVPRWYRDEAFDLFVWVDERCEAEVKSFQLCYHLGFDQKAVTWVSGEGLRHDRVLEGDLSATSQATPILVPSGKSEMGALKSAFLDASINMPASLTRLIMDRLNEEDNG